MHPAVFLSYRRDDSASEARLLAQSPKEALGEDEVYMDTSGIEAGENWPESLRRALDSAGAVLALIGPEWLRMGDEYGIRRIDQSDDWVRRELETALITEKMIIPVLVRRAKTLRRDKLPDTLMDLADLKVLEIRRDSWDHDVKLVVSRFRSLQGSVHLRVSTQDPFPVPPPEIPDPLSEQKILAALNGSLSVWERVVSPLPEDPTKTRDELYRKYEFHSFRDAVEFMSEVAPGCDITIHHPRWENLWRNLYVRLTTWDIGHRITDRDIQLAKYLDKAYGDFMRRRK